MKWKNFATFRYHTTGQIIPFAMQNCHSQSYLSMLWMDINSSLFHFQASVWRILLMFMPLCMFIIYDLTLFFPLLLLMCHTVSLIQNHSIY